jgi:hypothetical protein
MKLGKISRQGTRDTSEWLDVLNTACKTKVSSKADLSPHITKANSRLTIRCEGLMAGSRSPDWSIIRPTLVEQHYSDEDSVILELAKCLEAKPRGPRRSYKGSELKRNVQGISRPLSTVTSPRFSLRLPTSPGHSPVLPVHKHLSPFPSPRRRVKPNASKVKALRQLLMKNPVQGV